MIDKRVVLYPDSHSCKICRELAKKYEQPIDCTDRSCLSYGTLIEFCSDYGGIYGIVQLDDTTRFSTVPIELIGFDDATNRENNEQDYSAEQEKIERDRIKLLQYQNLRENFSKLVREILGQDYYNNATDIYSSDQLCCEDILYTYRQAKLTIGQKIKRIFYQF